MCVYRDWLDYRGLPKKVSEFSLKRTFDLALFSSDTIVIIEAKAFEPFKSDQTEVFAKDREDLPRLLGRPIQVVLVALASSLYFDAYARYGRGSALQPFNGRLTWAAVGQHYGSDLLKRANAIYRKSPADLIDADTQPLWKHGADKEALLTQLQQEVEQRQGLITAMQSGITPET